jgi:hypothetical protein
MSAILYGRLAGQKGRVRRRRKESAGTSVEAVRRDFPMRRAVLSNSLLLSSGPKFSLATRFSSEGLGYGAG